MIQFTDMAFRKSTGTLNILQFLTCVISSGVLCATAGLGWSATIICVTLICELTSLLVATVIRKVSSSLPEKINNDEYELYIGMGRLIMIGHIFIMAFNTAFNLVLGIGVTIYTLWVI